MGQTFCMFKGPLEAHIKERDWAAWLSEHIERVSWPKRRKVDEWEPNLGQKTVCQVQLPRGYEGVKVCLPTGGFTDLGTTCIVIAPERILKYL